MHTNLVGPNMGHQLQIHFKKHLCFVEAALLIEPSGFNVCLFGADFNFTTAKLFTPLDGGQHQLFADAFSLIFLRHHKLINQRRRTSVQDRLSHREVDESDRTPLCRCHQEM